MKEGQNIEYKQHWRDEYLKWICGFANAEEAATTQETTQVRLGEKLGGKLGETQAATERY